MKQMMESNERHIDFVIMFVPIDGALQESTACNFVGKNVEQI